MTTPTKAPGEKDWEFLLVCLMHTTEKPNFEAVAKQIGLPSAKSAYKRHWDIMKKHGVTSTSTSTSTGGGGNASPTPAGKKRSRPPAKSKDKTTGKKGGVKAEAEEDDDGSDGEETPSKKVKAEAKDGEDNHHVIEELDGSGQV